MPCQMDLRLTRFVGSFDKASALGPHVFQKAWQDVGGNLGLSIGLVLGKDRLALFSLVGLDGLEGAGCLGRHPGYGLRLGVSGCFRVGCRVLQQGALSGCLFPWRLAAGCCLSAWSLGLFLYFAWLGCLLLVGGVLHLVHLHRVWLSGLSPLAVSAAFVPWWHSSRLFSLFCFLALFLFHSRTPQ